MLWNPMFRVPVVARRLAVAVALAWTSAACNGSTEPGPQPSISIDFEGASLGSWERVGGDTIAISIREDTGFPQGFWFSFQVDAGLGRDLVFRVVDNNSLYGSGNWGTKQPVASSDGGETWTRVAAASVERGIFTFRHRPASEAERIALTLPYPFSRWLEVLASIESEAFVRRVEILGQSLDGNPLHLVEVSDPSVPDDGKSLVWAVARQHPGEPEGSYMIEGFLDWILGDAPGAVDLRRKARILLVPFLNPDGVIRGNQRVNRAGLDLNRQWASPHPATSPTVLAAIEAILAARNDGLGVRIMLDFHGAPLARSNFFYFNQESDVPPSLYAEMLDLMEAAVLANPEFVPVEFSTARPVQPGERTRNWAFQNLGTHGLTIEASGTDVSYGPFAGQQLTEARYLALGEAVALAVWGTLYN